MTDKDLYLSTNHIRRFKDLRGFETEKVIDTIAEALLEKSHGHFFYFELGETKAIQILKNGDLYDVYTYTLGKEPAEENKGKTRRQTKQRLIKLLAPDRFTEEDEDIQNQIYAAQFRKVDHYNGTTSIWFSDIELPSEVITYIEQEKEMRYVEGLTQGIDNIDLISYISTVQDYTDPISDMIGMNLISYRR